MLPAKIFKPRLGASQNLLHVVIVEGLSPSSTRMEINMEAFYNRTRIGHSRDRIDLEGHIPEPAAFTRNAMIFTCKLKNQFYINVVDFLMYKICRGMKFVPYDF
jgi:hypothetical protein